MFIEELCGMLVHLGPQGHPDLVLRGLLRLGGVGGRPGRAGFEQRAAYVGDVHDVGQAGVSLTGKCRKRLLVMIFAASRMLAVVLTTVGLGVISS
jgi:hypothetical protein